MATTTTNMALRKPDVTDTVSVATDINNNMDTIDAHDHAVTARGLPVQRLTTGQVNGDTFYATSASAIARLAIGATNQVLGVVAGIPSWLASLQSLMTTTGDIVYASSANTPARLAIGAAAQILTVSGGIPAWAASGVTLAGSDTTERTTTSTTDVSLSTTTVSIDVATPFFGICSFRKTTGAAIATSLGLMLNATTVVSTAAVTSSTNEVETGVFMFWVSAHDANYLRTGIIMQMNSPTPLAVGNLFRSFTADIPNATITSVIIRASTGDAAVTCAVNNVRVYTFTTT